MAPSDTRFCWACGYALETDFTFCDLCGAPLEPADATETAGPSSAAESPPRADVDGSDHPLVQPTEATTPATGGMTTSDASLPAPTSPDATVEPSADAGSASPDRRLLWIVGGFAAALIVVVAVVTSLRGGSGGDQPTSVNETVHVPRDAPTMGWSAYADGHASVLAGRDTLYLLDGGDRPQLVAYDARDGRERWRTSVPSPRSEPDDVRTSGQILGDTIVTSSGTNDATVLAAIAASDGEVMWEQRTSGWLWSDLRDPRPGDDRVYLGEYASGAYRISSVELRDGAVAGSYRAASITTGGDVIVSVDDHDITLLDARDLRPTGSRLRASGPVGNAVPFHRGALAVVGRPGEEYYGFVSGDIEYLTDDEQPRRVSGLRSREADYVVALGGSRVLVAGDAGVEVADITDGQAESVWDHSDDLHSLCRAGGRLVVLLADRNWTTLNMHDVSTGDRLGSLAYASPDGEWWGPLSDVLCGDKALATFADGDTVEAVGLDGRRLWDLRVPGPYNVNKSIHGTDAHLVVTTYNADRGRNGETLFEVYE